MADVKKRKRSSQPDGDVAPGARRHPIADSKADFGWKEAKQLSTQNPPFILEPAGCQIPDDATFHVYTRERAKDDLPDDPTPLEKYEYLLYSNDHPLFEFKAREDPLTKWTRLYVGFENPTTGKKEMVQTKKLIVRAVAKDRLPSSLAAAEKDQPTSRMEMATELGRLFGTKRAKKAIVEKERNEIAMPATNADGSPVKMNRAEAATLDVIGEAGAGMATREELQATIDATKPVPKANLEAEDIHDVYDPMEIIGPSVLNNIPVKDWQDAVENNTELNLNSHYVARLVMPVGHGPNSMARLRLLRYIHYLIQYYTLATRKRSSRRAMRKKEFEEATGASSQMSAHLQNKYTNRGEINSYFDAMIITHILALASIIDSFEFDITRLRMDLRIDQEKFSQHFQEIGGRVVQAKEQATGKVVQVARLTLPLRFPKQRTIRRRG
ncbi:related to DNA-directed RNA polymerase A (I) chain [Cephalotrichum gorgonifer]|uniref:Related to DNA-directed RNA polymerase A (I) chain n=1 Tax=Cephalotrichum gorgonifer TaxID=2041049 RepID=A0AAE8MYB2_9PEZI|nr:related to DNA-directed RNA polymerase A (I) chain [Cephalotrichum gorgonifer]